MDSYFFTNEIISEMFSKHLCLQSIVVKLKLQPALQLSLPFSTSAGGLPLMV